MINVQGKLGLGILTFNLRFLHVLFSEKNRLIYRIQKSLDVPDETDSPGVGGELCGPLARHGVGRVEHGGP